MISGTPNVGPTGGTVSVSGEEIIDGGEVSAADHIDHHMPSGQENNSGEDMLAGETTGGDIMTISGEEVAQDEAGTSIQTAPPAPEGYPRFRFPIHAEDVALIRVDPVFGMDHDPDERTRISCRDYAGRGFPYCYDGHKGSDFLLLGGFEAMDQGSARVVAALAGTVVDTVDGNYDRCHTDIMSADVSCDGFPMRANYVTLRHEGGWETRYYHLKSGSVSVNLGDEVSCGEQLGLVGSSGYSAGPHLHFEVTDQFRLTWDPYAGPYSQSYTLWHVQTVSGEGSFPSAASSLPSTSCSVP